MADEYRSAEPKLSEEDVERLIQRLYDNAIENKKRSMEELDRRFYPTAEPKTISQEAIERSVARQVDQEMALRRERAEEADRVVYERNAAAASNPRQKKAHVMSSTDVEESVQRMYTDTLARKEANMEESKRRYLHHHGETKKMSKSVIKESADRLSKPKKTEFSVSEINKIYGL